jgi:hypothetical protein
MASKVAKSISLPYLITAKPAKGAKKTFKSLRS